ncbi:MAG: hypothetical protein ACE5EO_11360 [Candidatus Krumholzibacteriia bacterium]
MDAIARMITALFDIVLVPYGDRHTVGLVALSLLTGIAMAYVFKWTSDAAAIKAAKEKLKGRILEMRIYQDDPVLIVRGFGGTLGANGVYLGTLLKPFLILIVPVVIVFMQMDERYSRRPLSEGETTIVSVALKQGVDPFRTEVGLSVNGGVAQDARPVRVGETGEIAWRLRVTGPGTHEVTLSGGGGLYTFPVVAEDGYRMIGHVRNAGGLVEPMLHPALAAIPEGSPFERITVDYPGASYPFLSWHLHWIAIFVIYSFAAAIALKFIIKFEI